MEEKNEKTTNEVSLITKISPDVILNNLLQFFNNDNKYIFPLLLSKINPQSFEIIKNSAEKLLKSHNITKKSRTEINNLIILYNFFFNSNKTYKEQYNNKNCDITKINDPIMDMFNKIEKDTKDINESGLNYKKYFYNYLLNVPYINISPCCSLMNIIYFNEYYRKLNDKNKKPKILNLILFIEEEISKCRINDLFGEIIFNQKNFVIKNNKIIFNYDLFINVISNIYREFNHPLRIIINGGNKVIKHNFKKNEFIKDSILFKLAFKSDSLLIIHRV